MSDIAVRVENLSKLYRIGQTVGYKTLRESLMWVATTPLRRLRSTSHDPSTMSHQPNTIWALKDVSFEIKRGEAVGIIGRNGSGKTTLLKILSRITAPTEGYAEVHGRAGSLLEVGTGFHPELTGRENIYLNGAIIGMKKAEVERKFDEIVAFSEIEKFLDTPVKRYSSGMYVRLAFSVAAHLEPDILLVDEVLAVGDAAFQKKCLGKMGSAAQEGRTVVFVSHNMAAVQELCQRAILLREGQIVEDNSARKVVSNYLSAQSDSSSGDRELSDPSLRCNSLADSRFHWTRVTILNSAGKATNRLALGEPFDIIMTGILKEQVDDLIFGFGVMSALGFPLFNSHTTDANLPKNYPAGEITFKVRFEPNIFGPGSYTVDLGANGPGVIDWIPEAIDMSFEEVSRDVETSVRSNYSGVVIYPCKWSLAHEHTS